MIKSDHHNYSRKELDQTGVYSISHIMMYGHIYIGSASKHDRIKYRDVGFLQRWRNHLSTLRNGTHKNTFLQRVVTKYGLGGLRFKIVEACTPEKCIEKENYYLQEFKKTHSLYNAQTANASRLGAHHSEETKRKIGNGRNKKKVYQFSFDGELVKVFECLYHVLDEFPSGGGSIWMCLNNKQQTSFGYIWSYSPIFEFKPFNGSRSVIQYDGVGNIIKEFPSSAEAIRKTKIWSVHLCCIGERKTAGGYYWKFKNAV